MPSIYWLIFKVWWCMPLVDATLQVGHNCTNGLLWTDLTYLVCRTETFFSWEDCALIKIDFVLALTLAEGCDVEHQKFINLSLFSLQFDLLIYPANKAWTQGRRFVSCFCKKNPLCLQESRAFFFWHALAAAWCKSDWRKSHPLGSYTAKTIAWLDSKLMPMLPWTLFYHIEHFFRFFSF